MNRYLQPRSDQARRIALERLHLKGVEDQQEGIIYLRPETLAQIGSLRPQFVAAVNSLQSWDSVRMNAVAEASAASESVANQIRAIWQAVKRRTKLGGLPVAVRLYYGLPANGKNPAVNSQNGWLAVGDDIVAGEAQAVNAGYPALVEPTVASLQTGLAAARTAINQREAAKTARTTALDTLEEQRQQVDALIIKAMSELRSALTAETAARRRDIMRGYGARFGQRTEDEPVVEEEVEPQSLAAPAAMGVLQPYAVHAVNGNGTAVRV